MVEADVTRVFLSLAPDDQASFLASLAHHMTVCGRATAQDELDPQEVVERLLALNEIQEAITGQLIGLLRNSNARYPDDVFVKVLFERSPNGKMQSDLTRAFTLVSRRFSQR